MKVVLDTSCLVSFFLMDAHHSKAQSMLGRIVKGETEALISALSLAELCGVVRRNTDEETAKEVQSKICELVEKGLIGVVPLKVSDAYGAGEIAIMTALKGADAVVVHAAKANDSRLFTFDEEITKRAKNHVEFFEL